MDTKQGEGAWDELGDWDWHICTVDTMYTLYRASLGAQLVKNPPAMLRDPSSIPGSGRSPGERIAYPVFLGFPGDSDSKESTCNGGELGSTPEWERYPGGEHGNPLQYFCLENPHGQRSLEGYSPWGRKESDMTERLSIAHSTSQNQQNRDSQSYFIPAAEPRRFGPALNSLFFFFFQINASEHSGKSMEAGRERRSLCLTAFQRILVKGFNMA